MTHQEYQEHLENGGTGRTFRLSGLTDALIYHLGEIGTIRDLRLQINYNKVSNTDLVFGAGYIQQWNDTKRQFRRVYFGQGIGK